MFYAADGTVRAVDWRFIQQPGSVIAPKKFAFEEYRYDALGRRVWMRSQKTCEDRGLSRWWEAAECKTSVIRRTVWDSEQELVEIQMPGGTAANEVALHENDTARVQLPSLSTAAGTADRNQYFGRVIYTPGRAVDQPLAVTRINYGFQHDDGGGSITYRVKAPFTTMPFWDAKGDAPIGVFTNGTRLLCEPAGTPGICVGVVWPYFWSAYDRHRITVWDNWQGSLLERKRDKTGLEYKRNRYYDPQTGRFTQEDPIGFEGGLNLYGFANGDPINFGDPFGTAPCRRFGNCLQGDGGKADVYDAFESHNPMFGRAFATLADPTSSFAEKVEAFVEVGSFGMGGVSAGRGGNLAKPALSAVKGALARVHELVGKQPRGLPGKFGSPQRGTSVRGYRLDPPHARAEPGSPDSKWHINFWDWTQGGKRTGGEWGAIPIE